MTSEINYVENYLKEYANNNKLPNYSPEFPEQLSATFSTIKPRLKVSPRRKKNAKRLFKL